MSKYDFTVTYTAPSVFPTKELEDQWVASLQSWVDEDKANRYFTDEVKAELLDSMGYWCRDFKKPPEVLERFKFELSPDRYWGTINDPILREYIVKFVYLMEAPIGYHHGDDSCQRREFCEWVEHETGSAPSLTYNPYSDEIHQIWWYAYEQALIFRFY